MTFKFGTLAGVAVIATMFVSSATYAGEPLEGKLEDAAPLPAPPVQGGIEQAVTEPLQGNVEKRSTEPLKGNVEKVGTDQFNGKVQRPVSDQSAPLKGNVQTSRSPLLNGHVNDEGSIPFGAGTPNYAGIMRIFQFKQINGIPVVLPKPVTQAEIENARFRDEETDDG